MEELFDDEDGLGLELDEELGLGVPSLGLLLPLLGFFRGLPEWFL